MISSCRSFFFRGEMLDRESTSSSSLFPLSSDCRTLLVYSHNAEEVDSSDFVARVVLVREDAYHQVRRTQDLLPLEYGYELRAFSYF
jgi:hypothetical protein